MKTSAHKITTALAMGFSLFYGAIAHAATVTFSDLSPKADVGSSFSLTLKGASFPTIVSGGLDLSYDASILQVDTVTINQSVFEFYQGNGVEEGVKDNVAGSLKDTSFNTFVGATGDFDIMSIGFTAIGQGSTTLNLSESTKWVFADFFGGYVGDQVAFESATVTVSAVPLPAGFGLLAAGLGLLGLFNRKRISA